MFIDEELEECYKMNYLMDSKVKAIHQALVNRFPDPTTPINELLVKVKQIDNGYRLFCKRHQEFNPDGFRNLILKADHTGKFKKVLNW